MSRVALWWARLEDVICMINSCFYFSFVLPDRIFIDAAIQKNID